MNTYRRVKADPAEWFAADDVAKAKRYQRPLTVARVARAIIGLAAIIAIISTHAGPRLADALGASSWPLRLLSVLAGLLVVFTLVDLPFSIWTTFVHDRRYGFSTETPAGFISDEVKGFAVSFVLLGGISFLLWTAVRATALWWVIAWIGFLLVSVVFAFLFPVLILPLFNRFTPLDDESLAGRLRQLASSAGLDISDVQVMDASRRTRKDNAFFTGLGRSRRVVLFDNLLVQPVASIESIVAHEIGHWRRRHVARQVLLGTILSLGLFVALRLVSGWPAALDWAGVSSLRDPASLPLVVGVFLAGNGILGFVQGWVSRAFERQADLEALELTRDPEAFQRMMRDLVTKNLSELAPSWWTYIRSSHPPPAERLQLSELWTDGRQAAPTAGGR